MEANEHREARVETAEQLQFILDNFGDEMSDKLRDNVVIVMWDAHPDRDTGDLELSTGESNE